MSAHGVVVLQTFERLWTFAVDGGAPLHADLGTPTGAGTNMAVFATDTLLWTDGSGTPSLFDLTQPRDRSTGWKVVYSWHEAHAQAGGSDYWFQPSPAVQRDGTLIWTSRAGVTRALEVTGEVRWQIPAAEGTFLVTSDDVVIRSKDGEYVAFEQDGGLRWQAPLPAGATELAGWPQAAASCWPAAERETAHSSPCSTREMRGPSAGPG